MEKRIFRIKEVDGCTDFQHVTLTIVKREIYLTFDDGIQAGTEEVLALLKEKKVKATFFLTGIHLYYFIEKHKDRKQALNVLKDIYENPHLNLYMGYVVDMETGEVFPGNLRLNKGKYEVFKVVAD